MNYISYLEIHLLEYLGKKDHLHLWLFGKSSLNVFNCEKYHKSSYKLELDFLFSKPLIWGINKFKLLRGISFPREDGDTQTWANGDCHLHRQITLPASVKLAQLTSVLHVNHKAPTWPELQRCRQGSIKWAQLLCSLSICLSEIHIQRPSQTNTVMRGKPSAAQTARTSWEISQSQDFHNFLHVYMGKTCLPWICEYGLFFLTHANNSIMTSWKTSNMQI